MGGAFASRVQKRVLTYDATKKTIVEERYSTTGAAPIVWKSTGSKKTLVTNVVPDPKFAPAAAEPTIFRYYAFGSATAPAVPKPDVELINPNSTAIATIARIDVGFTTRAGSEKATKTSEASLSLRSQVYIRAADPNDPAPYPTCV